MMIFDVILLLILAGFVFYGLFFGLIKTLGSLAGVIIGAWVASNYYLQFYEFADNLFMGHDNIGRVVSFLVLFGIANRLVGLLFYLLDKVFHFISIIPFLKSINRLAGAVFGFLEGGIVLGLLLHVISKYAIIGNWFSSSIAASKMTPFLLKFNTILLPLLPEFLDKAKSIV